MIATKPLQTITVGGDALHARIVAILLDNALSQYGCKVALGRLEENDLGDRPIILGPTVHAALAGVSVSPNDLLTAGAKQRFHWQLPGMKVWSTSFGVPRGGVDFHHHLHRISGKLSYELIEPFNPARHLAAYVAEHGPLKAPPIPFGFTLEPSRLNPLICNLAEKRGLLEDIISKDKADLSVTIFGDGSAEWEGREVSLPLSGAFPELGLYRCITACDRLFSLLPGGGDWTAQRKEFNRLSFAEHERIGDFSALLLGDFDRPALLRKRDVFVACGRIPIEDYEVIPQHYWLSVFLQKEIEPADYNRLADRFPVQETQGWIDGIRRQIDQLSRWSFA